MKNLKKIYFVLTCSLFLLSTLAKSEAVTAIHKGSGGLANVGLVSYLVIYTPTKKIALIYQGNNSDSIQSVQNAHGLLESCEKMAFVSMTDPSLNFNMIVDDATPIANPAGYNILIVQPLGGVTLELYDVNASSGRRILCSLTR